MTSCCDNGHQYVRELCHSIPKVELHLHIEGTFEPELLFSIAKRNGVDLKYKSVEELRAAYKFSNLQEFLDIYYQGMNVLLQEQDFFDLTYAYFKRVNQDNLKHAEIFFDPQGHTDRGVAFDVVLRGITNGMAAAEKDFGITSFLILSFLRHLSEESAFATLEQAKPFLKHFVAVGLDSSEVGHPPEKFERVFAAARALGLRAVAHAGEEGDPAYVWGALQKLQVERIDHGVRSIEDPELIAHLVEKQIPLTMCPLSNLKLCVVDHLAKHKLMQFIESGACVTINSDDPAYFGGYMTDNYVACLDALDMRPHDVIQCAHNAVNAAFLPAKQKVELHRRIREAVTTVEQKYHKITRPAGEHSPVTSPQAA